LSRPLDDLEDMLLHSFAGKKLSTEQIYLSHSVGKPYVRRNYKHILIRMEQAGKIIADPPAEKRQKRQGQVTFSDRVLVTFPNKRAK
jgi:hypothetical protein